MTVEVELINRIYTNLCEFCDANGLDVQEYMSNAITERYNLDKYGDLNEKLAKKEEKKPTTKRTKKNQSEAESATEEFNKIVVDKLVSMVKGNDEQDNRAQTDEIREEVIKEETEETKQPIIEPIVVQGDVDKPKKVRRTLKTK